MKSRGKTNITMDRFHLNRLNKVLVFMHNRSHSLDPVEASFFSNIFARWEIYEDRIRISVKQWNWLMEIYRKMGGK